VKLLALTLVLSVAIGYVLGGRMSALGALHLRWAPLAIAALLLQVIVPPGSWPLVLLLASFALLTVFVVVNRRIAGFWLILAGVALNFAVIGLNGGMPVSGGALESSGQATTVGELTGPDHGVKHHLATGSDTVVFLGDVIAIPPPLGQAISVGDICTYGGVAVVVITGMRRRGVAVPAGREELQHAG
jgi:hypothetical protein